MAMGYHLLPMTLVQNSASISTRTGGTHSDYDIADLSDQEGFYINHLELHISNISCCHRYF